MNIAPQNIFIKICGITRPEDAQLSHQLGASALGLIFAPSPRQVTLRQAQKIRRSLPTQARLIGVFVNSPLDEILHHVEQVGLNGAQLHGDETLAFSRQLKVRRPDVPLIRTVFPDSPLDHFADPSCDLYLLDQRKSSDGGKVSQYPLRPAGPFLIASGVNAENLADKLKKSGSIGVDLCRGVEESPGLKNAAALERIFQRAKEVVR